MTTFSKTLIACALVSTLVGCASTQEKQNKPQGNIGLPGWILNPSVEKGLAESACVPWSGMITVDRDQATAIARNGLVQQIQIRAANLTKTFAHKTDTVSGTNVGTNFETSAQQLAEGTLKGTKAVKADVFDVDHKKQFCVMVTLEERDLDSIAKQIISSSGAKLSSDDQRVITEELKAKDGQQELKEALKP